MIVRKPNFNFSSAAVIWSVIPEFSILQNANSVGAPHVEPYLNKVMQQARQQLKLGQERLAQEIDTFIMQESTHYLMHIQFNKLLYNAGFGAVKSLEEKLSQELKAQLKERSLGFNLAYCAGFESFTLFTAKFMFDEAADLFDGADPGGANLWLWHFAEEFEHRAVCHEAFATLSGNYFVRVLGLFYAFYHLNKFVSGVSAIMLAKYRETMSVEERSASVAREMAYKKRYALYAFPRMLNILVPFYDPAKYKPSANIQRALDRYATSISQSP